MRCSNFTHFNKKGIVKNYRYLFSPRAWRTPIGIASLLLGMVLLSACAVPAQPGPVPTLTAQPAVQAKATSTSIPTTSPAVEDTPTPQTSPTPAAAACSSPAGLTPAMTEGPYFKAGSPERSSLLEGQVQGLKLVLSGIVLDGDCKPVAHALLDFWQADSGGQYDNAGYIFRGHQFSDANGRYQLETVVPGLYPGRTEHIHVKVQAPNGPLLTTQLFFPGVVQNDSDGIFDERLLIQVQKNGDGMLGVYNFFVSLK